MKEQEPRGLTLGVYTMRTGQLQGVVGQSGWQLPWFPSVRGR